MGTSYPGLECHPKQENDIFFPNRSQPHQNCEQYLYDGQGTYYCKKCKFGYSGKVMENDSFFYVECE